MARCGQLVEYDGKHGTSFALRFRLHGQRHHVTLGSTADGFTRDKAEEEARFVMAQVERGVWAAPARASQQAAAPVEDPVFRGFASAWIEAREPELRPSTVLDYQWQLTHHLLPFFGRHRLSEITIAEVDRYRQHKVREGQLSATSINKTLTRLAQILEVAVEYGMLDRNTAAGKRRRVKASKPRPVHLDSADQIAVLLEAAAALDRERGYKTRGRLALLATLVLAGLRVGEACALRWRDVDLANGRITVGDSKTDAGRRRIDMLPALRDHLVMHKMACGSRTGAADLVFTTKTGQPRDKDNVRSRVLAPVVVRANDMLEERDRVPLPTGLTPHKLRHTFASVLVALGEDPGHVMDQLGHTDPEFTLRVYRHAMRRDDGERERLRALVAGSATGLSAVPDPAQRAATTMSS